MRLIYSNKNVPTENLAEWLLETLKKYPINFGCSVKNSIELVNNIKNLKKKRGYILCSFDLQDMYTNIPVEEAIQCLKKHLEKSNSPQNEIQTCIEIAKTCMNQHFFQFRGKYYKQNSGLLIGCKLSPLLANIYMCNMEEKLKKKIISYNLVSICR